MTQNTPAILWDLDGTIVDSKDCHFQSWSQTLKKRGVDLDEADFIVSFGRNTKISLPLYLGYEPEPVLFDQLVSEKDAIFMELVLNQSKLIPGVESWLATAKENGIKQAVASSSDRETIEILLEKFGLQDYFDEIVPGAELPAKPEPDIFLMAAQKLDRKPEHCVVIEDSLAGLQGAKNAGMKCVAVTTSFPCESLTIADWVVDDFTSPLLPLLKEIELL